MLLEKNCIFAMEVDELTLDESLDRLAGVDGEGTLAPHEGQDLESFQADVRRVREYARQGYVTIVREHPESKSGQHYIDRVRVRLTESGVAWRKQLNPSI